MLISAAMAHGHLMPDLVLMGGLCRISRDVTERGRNVAVVIEQYTSQVKPAFERFVRPSRKHADVIIPWSRRVPSNQGVIHRAVHPG